MAALFGVDPHRGLPAAWGRALLLGLGVSGILFGAWALHRLRKRLGP
ncbi:hypothetical protein [Myxococcus sp. SDU36]|nr:hypothetical protein [Myxococcus sp. SDU36]WIG97174.1 hypothetical protein KGD87_07215 [Myxococcus sp. SDU36]